MREGISWSKGRIPLLFVILMVTLQGFTNVLGQDVPSLKGSLPISTDPWWMHWSRDVDHGGMDDELEYRILNSGPDDDLRLFVDYDHRPDHDDIRRLESLDASIVYRSKYLDTLIIDLRADVIHDLMALPHVVMLEADPDIEWNLDSASRSVQLDVVKSNWSYDGQGIVIGIVDSGVNANHTGLNDLDDINETYDPKVIAFYDAKNDPDKIDGTKTPYDDDGHGSHVSGIAAGTGEGSQNYEYQGVAPRANIVGIKVLGVSDNTMSDAMRGLEWARDNKAKYGISILSLSFGARLATGVTNDGNSAISRLCDDLVEYGFVVVVSAGNSGPRRKSIAPPGDARQVITVGNVQDSGVLLSSSSRGPVGDWNNNYIKPDVCAPGTDIWSVDYNTVSNYTSKTGTSMSAPFVSGVVALMLQIDGTLTPTQVKNLLEQTAGGEESFFRQGSPNNDYGFGVIHPLDLVNNLTGGVKPPKVSLDDIGPLVRGKEMISGTAESDFGPIQKVEVQTAVGDWGSAVGAEDWSYEWDTTLIPNGQSEFRVRAYDGTLYSVLLRKYVTINNIDIKASLPSDPRYSGNSSIGGRAKGLVITSVEARIDDGAWQPTEPLGTGGASQWSRWDFAFNTKDYKGRVHTFVARAYDGDAYTESEPYQIFMVGKGNKGTSFIPGFEPIFLISALALTTFIVKRDCDRRNIIK